ncbi:MAG TPA: CYTH domain-containing protein [Steroidobacteraceae bacterium]|nr:CYTH domain-containing protein [Steroidobacteraceae bacterium]
MATEIERKFLVRGEEWRRGTVKRVRQGYLSRDRERTVRVRIAGKRASLTIKGAGRGTSRPEFEYRIPLRDAAALLALCDRPPLEKNRYTFRQAGVTWEVDEFLGANAGLVVAEIELEDEQQAFKRPAWLSTEVTQDPRYLNSSLVDVPYSSWGRAGG